MPIESGEDEVRAVGSGLDVGVDIVAAWIFRPLLGRRRHVEKGSALGNKEGSGAITERHNLCQTWFYCAQMGGEECSGAMTEEADVVGT